MKFHILSIMPDMIRDGLKEGLVAQAFKKNICELNVVNPRDFTEDKHQSVDDRPFGGGDGMVMMAPPMQKSLDSLDLDSTESVYFLSPRGRTFNDTLAIEMSQKKDITLICGRYAGIDQRFLVKNKIQELSIGDYVLSGGELAALVVVDSVVRKIPGVLGHEASASNDSFAGSGNLESASFTRPRTFEGMDVPEPLLSGDHKKITSYRYFMGVLTTLQFREDLIGSEFLLWKEASDFFKELSENELTTHGLDGKTLKQKLEYRLK